MCCLNSRLCLLWVTETVSTGISVWFLNRRVCVCACVGSHGLALPPVPRTPTNYGFTPKLPLFHVFLFSARPPRAFMSASLVLSNTPDLLARKIRPRAWRWLISLNKTKNKEQPPQPLLSHLLSFFIFSKAQFVDGKVNILSVKKKAYSLGLLVSLPAHFSMQHVGLALSMKEEYLLFLRWGQHFPGILWDHLDCS